MFKVIGQLTNVRPSKTEEPELATAPSEGMIKLNQPACTLLGVVNGDYITVVPAEDESGKAIYVAKGAAGTETTAQVGAKLSSASGKERVGGTLQFGSSNAWQTLGGNKGGRVVFGVSSTPVEFQGVNYYKLTFVRNEEKAERKKKEAANA